MAETKGIFLRGDIFWIIYAGPDGKMIRVSTGSKLKRDAEALLTSRKDAKNMVLFYWIRQRTGRGERYRLTIP